MKKIFILLMTAFLMSGCTQNSSETLKEAAEDGTISKIKLVDGRSGEKYIITEKANLELFNQLVTERSYKKISNRDDVKGYMYHVVVYSGSKKMNVTFLGDAIRIEDRYYSLDQPITFEDVSLLLK